MHSLSRRKLPALTTEQMREVDRVIVEDLHIELVQMMENAGRSLAELAIDRFSPGSVTVTSCQSPPLRLRLLPWAWPGALSPT